MVDSIGKEASKGFSSMLLGVVLSPFLLIDSLGPLPRTLYLHYFLKDSASAVQVFYYIIYIFTCAAAILCSYNCSTKCQSNRQTALSVAFQVSSTTVLIIHSFLCR